MQTIQDCLNNREHYLSSLIFKTNITFQVYFISAGPYN